MSKVVLSSIQAQILKNVNRYSQNIRNAYVTAGYALTQIAPPEISRKGKLSFTIFVPKVGEIRVTGNAKTTEAEILEQLTFKTGDYYSEKAVIASLAKVGKLPTILEVRASPEPGAANRTMNIKLKIREK